MPRPSASATGSRRRLAALILVVSATVLALPLISCTEDQRSEPARVSLEPVLPLRPDTAELLSVVPREGIPEAPGESLEPWLGEWTLEVDASAGHLPDPHLLVVERSGELLFVTAQGIETVDPAQTKLQMAADVPSLEWRGRRFQSVPFTATTGAVFRIEPRAPIDELRAAALSAEPPEEDPLPPRSPELVELTDLDSSIALDVRYASDRNFMGSVFYEQPRAFLQRPAALALASVQQALAEHGFGILVYDAYRPWHVTKMFWDATPDHQREFVANPAGGSRHNRGCAIDLTLVDLETGEPVSMPSGYDEFSRRAYPDYPAWTARQAAMRELLTSTMLAHGFEPIANEWWHFDYRDWREYPLMNVRFQDL